MGNHKFRLSDMMPNAWFHKLKDMSKPRKNPNSPHHSKKKKQQQQKPTFAPTAKFTEPSKPKQQLPHQCLPRQSYYFTRELASPAPGHRFCSSSPTNPKASDTNFPDPPPKKPSKQKPKKRITSLPSDPHLVTSSVSAGCGCRATIESVWTKSDSPPELWSSSTFDSSPEPESHDEDDGELELHEPEFRCDRVLTTETFDGMVSMSSSCAAYLADSEEKDVVIDVDKASLSTKLSDVKPSDMADDGLYSFSELELAPIITKPPKFSEMVRDVKKKKETKEPSRCRRSSAKFQDRNAHGSLSVKVVKEESTSTKTIKEQRTASSVRRVSLNATSPGVRLRMNSPRIANRKINQANLSRRSVSSNSSSKRRSLSESFAIVKSSFDPQRDFRESMVEMIMENNIKASKDLEDLLACYLSLNSDEYHELIIKVFKQIWFDLTDLRSK